MKTIYKYDLITDDLQTLKLPSDYELLCVQTQNGQPKLWAKVDTDSPSSTTINIFTFGTGHPMPETGMFYLGTYQLHGGALVFHVFTDIHPSNQ